MKRFLYASLFMGLLSTFCVLPVTMAKEPAKISKKAKPDKKSKKSKSEEEDDTAPCPSVPSAIREKKLVSSAKLDTKAKVYFIYQSRSTCGICVAEIPAILKSYEEMKGRGAEIVMLNIDKDLATAEAWVKKANITFPVVAPKDHQNIPFPYSWGEGTNLLPIMVALDAHGNKLGQANGGEVPNFLKSWRVLAAGKENNSIIHDILKEKKYATSAKPNPKARVFFLMRAPGKEGEMADISKAYSGMRGKGAELIVVHNSKDKSAASNWAKKEKVRCPILLADDTSDLPSPTSREMPIIALDAAGNNYSSADATDAISLLKSWKDILHQADEARQEADSTDTENEPDES